jgi:hypothetical protein
MHYVQLYGLKEPKKYSILDRVISNSYITHFEVLFLKI